MTQRRKSWGREGHGHTALSSMEWGTAGEGPAGSLGRGEGSEDTRQQEQGWKPTVPEEGGPGSLNTCLAPESSICGAPTLSSHRHSYPCSGAACRLPAAETALPLGLTLSHTCCRSAYELWFLFTCP